MAIHILSSEIAALIAAGEVVQRPASVVKELIDNALDAQATRVHVQLEQGGLQQIRVVDNGCGMSREDAELCMEKHATSKIATSEDLKNILTLGFRGEALAAIGAVAEVEILTRRREDTAGTRIVARDARHTCEDAGCPAGTSVTVSDIFGAVPARRKFLKTGQTEFRHCTDTVIRTGLVNESVHFTLEHGTRRSLELPRCNSRAERLHALLGKEVFDQLYAVDYRRNDITVQGWISAPTLNRNNRSQIYLFVNDRYVQSRTLMSALLESYRNVLPKGRFPVAVLFLELDPLRVDINVHPSKMEIRFDDDSAAFRAVHGAVHNTLATGGSGWAPGDTVEQPAAPDGSGSGPGRETPPQRHHTQHPSLEHTHSVLNSFLAAPPEAQSTPGDDTADNPPLRPVASRRPGESFTPRAYVLGTFLIAESHDRLMMLDTHAAHERIVYERLKTMFADGDVESQNLLFPVQLELSPAEGTIAEQNPRRLERLGFSLSPFGEQTWLLNAIPVHTDTERCAQLLHDLLADFEKEGGADSVEQLYQKMLITMSCHSAHRAGDQMDRDDMEALLEQYFATPHHETCPHGRPTAVYWTAETLGRLFARG